MTLDVTELFAQSLKPDASVALRDPEGMMLAALHVEDMWQPDRLAEAEAVFGHVMREHPGVAELLDRSGTWCVEVRCRPEPAGPLRLPRAAANAGRVARVVR